MEKVALITGASQGLGSTLATFLGGQGYDLVITAQKADTLKAKAESLAGLKVKVTALAGDVADAAHRARLADAAQSMGRLDVLINNASILGPSPMPDLADYDLDDLRRVLEVNFIAPVGLIQATLPLLRAGHGLVANVTSDAARGGYPGWGGYGTSKAALELASATLGGELRDQGVAVVCVDPGEMRTSMYQESVPGEDISDVPLPDVTLPFWAWLLGQDPMSVSGKRFQAQEDHWEVGS